MSAGWPTALLLWVAGMVLFGRTLWARAERVMADPGRLPVPREQLRPVFSLLLALTVMAWPLFALRELYQMWVGRDEQASG